MKLLVWWQLRSVNPDGQDEGWLSWDHDLDDPYRFDTVGQAFAALETYKRDGKWHLAEGWSGRVVRVVQEIVYYDEEVLHYPFSP